jgi:hypothetical protein
MSVADRYRVLTLDQPALKDAAQRLYALAQRDFAPQLIVGVRTGGYLAAELMDLQDGAILLPLTSQRPGTSISPGTEAKNRSSFFKHWLRRLPYFVNDRLRIFEHRVLLRKANRTKGERTLRSDELEAIAAAVAEGRTRILIVDDAVDSGSTLLAVSARLCELTGSGGIVRTAAITVTTPRPLVEPDYILYRNVLCRFHWSFDFRS